MYLLQQLQRHARSWFIWSNKSGLTFLAETLKIELEQFNIKVQVIHPGFIKTPMTDKNNFQMPFLMNSEKAARIIFAKMNSNVFEIFFQNYL